MKTLILTVIGSVSLAGYGFYDAYRHMDCSQVAESKEQIYKNPSTGEVTKVVIQKCVKPA